MFFLVLLLTTIGTAHSNSTPVTIYVGRTSITIEGTKEEQKSQLISLFQRAEKTREKLRDNQKNHILSIYNKPDSKKRRWSQAQIADLSNKIRESDNSEAAIINALEMLGEQDPKELLRNHGCLRWETKSRKAFYKQNVNAPVFVPGKPYTPKETVCWLDQAAPEFSFDKFFERIKEGKK